MNRQTPGAQRTAQIPAGYRPAQAQSSTTANPMYYATAGAGAQATPQGQTASSRGMPPAGYASARTGGGPPGFASRPPGAGSGDQGDFPALGSSSYASQAQFLTQQSLQPPGPPPGISAPVGAGASGGHQQSNGPRDEQGGDEFPALGGGRGGGPGSVVSDGKDRLSAYVRNTQAPPSPPTTLPNGAASGSHSNSATPSINLQSDHAQAQAQAWLRETQSQTPSSRAIDQITRPAQQLMSSPVDQWGLKALLYEIRMGKPDRSLLMFGEDLSEMGVDVNSDEPLYPTFVTPWLDPSQQPHPPQIEERYHIPSCYTMLTAPPMSSKLNAFTEETLLYIFYSSPQDVAQLESADELYSRGWRYHIPSQTWMTGGIFANFDPREQAPTTETPWLVGPVTLFDVAKFARLQHQQMSFNPLDFEATRPAHAIVAEETARKGATAAAGASGQLKTPNGTSNQGQLPVR